jgi:hypothetical protein
MDKIRLSVSRVETFITCREKYRWVYLEELEPKDKAIPLQVGDIVHWLIHRHDLNTLTFEQNGDFYHWVQERYPHNTEELTKQVADQAWALLTAYKQRAKQDDIELVTSEIHLELEEADFFIYARLDQLAKINDKFWRVEHKTAGRLDSAYLQGLKSNLQTGIYHYVIEQVLKKPVQGTIFNLLVKTKTPYCEINAVLKNRRVMQRSLLTFQGVARDIKRGDYYPTGVCYGYSKECEYLQLCNNPTDEVKSAFYQQRRLR